jgi:lysophospholipase L1-like esterase
VKSVRRLLPLLAPAFLLACAQSPPPAAAIPAPTQRWLATWTAPQAPARPRPPADSADGTPTYSNRTFREIVHTSIGGDRVRIRVSNEYGDQPLIIDAAHLAARDTGDAIVIATDRAITFGGRPSLMLRPGATAVSDAVPFNVPATSDLAVSLHLAAPARLATRHGLAMQRNYVSPDGDFTAAPVFTFEATTSTFPFLAGVDVVNDRATGVVVALGNSITDGARSTSGTNSRWPDVLARRLLASTEPPKGVANAGISGNRVLTFGTGPSALARFDRDVLLVPGVTHVIVLEGINDIRAGINRPGEAITADDLIFGYRQLIARAHERGLVIIGGTLTPAGGAERHPPENEAIRQAVNAWIRTSGAFDAVIDFDRATRDPAHPDRLLPAFDSGDHLHPSDAGYRAMGEAIDLSLFRLTTHCCSPRSSPSSP